MFRNLLSPSFAPHSHRSCKWLKNTSRYKSSVGMYSISLSDVFMQCWYHNDCPCFMTITSFRPVHFRQLYSQVVHSQKHRFHRSRFTNSTHLLSHTCTWPQATCWPVIRDIAVRLDMKVQEAGGTLPPLVDTTTYD